MSNQNEQSRNEPPAILLRAAMLCLVAVALVSLYPPFGTALFGPPLYPWALATFLLLIVSATLLIGFHWQDLSARPERWALPLALAISASLWLSPFTDRAAFPSLGLLLLPAGVIVITSWISSATDRSKRCLCLLRVTAATAIGVSIWGLYLWAIVDYGNVVGMADHVAQLTGLTPTLPNLLALPNPHPFGHKNFVAGFALLTLPALALLLCLDRTRLRLLWLGGLPIVLFYLVSAESRGGWLGLAAGVAFYVAVRVLKNRARRLSWWLLPILLVVFAIPFIVSPRLRESVRRVSQEETLAAIDPYRWEMFQTGIAVGNAYPITGAGPGALSLVSPKYSTWEAFPVVYQVHSTPIQLYAETGALGLIGCLFLAWGVFWNWKRRRENAAATEVHLKDAAAAAIIGYAALALTDYQLDVPALVLALAVPVSLILTLGGSPPRQPLPKIWRSSAVFASLLLLPVVWFNIQGFLARRALAEALTYLERGDTSAFASAIEQAHRHAPSDPLYLNQLANAWMIQWLSASDSEERKQWAERAQQAWMQSLELAPAQDSVHFNLGVLRHSRKEPELALESFQQALRYNPQKRFAWFLSGQALLALGKEEAAAEAFAHELRANPPSLFLSLWESPEVRPHIEARNRSYLDFHDEDPVSPAQKYLFQWAIGEPQLFTGDSSNVSDGFRVLLKAFDGDIQTAIALAPLTPQALLLQAWVDPADAERWLRAAFLQARRPTPAEDDLAIIQTRLAEAETFSEAVRSLLEKPTITQIPSPRASGLFERNFYGAPLYDFFPHAEPVILPLLQANH